MRKSTVKSGVLAFLLFVTSGASAEIIRVDARAGRVCDSAESFSVPVCISGELRNLRAGFLGSKGHLENGKITFPAIKGGWPHGFREGVIEIAADGFSTNVPFFFLNEPRPETAVELDAEGYYRQRGNRLYPFGLYKVNIEDMAEVREHGFEIVHVYDWEKRDDNPGCQAYVNACGKNGLQAFVGFPRKRIIDGDFACIARRVGLLATNPALFCWYLFDEPALKSQYVSPERLTEFADLIRALDPYHPVVVTTWDEGMGEYRRSWDVHWSQAYGNEPAYVAHLVNQHRKWIGSPSPISLLLNSFDCEQNKAKDRGEIVKLDHSKFSHDRDFFRACAFLGIVKGCNGIWWWSFGRDDNRYVSVGNHAGAWADLTAVVKELDAYRPLALAEGRVVTGVATPRNVPVKHYTTPRVEWWAKTIGSQTSVIAVNVTPRLVEVDLDLPGMGKAHYRFNRFEVKILKY